MSRPRVFEWHKQFMEHRGILKDDDRPGRPRTYVTANKPEKLRDVIRNNRRLDDRAISGMVSSDREVLKPF